MSLRQIAAELGVSHTLLVLWRQGKRNLTPELEARYHQLVTSGGYKSGYNQAKASVGGVGEIEAAPKGQIVASQAGFEPATRCLEGNATLHSYERR